MLPRRQRFDYVSDILDEIALEGLDGITVLSLFERLKFRLNFIIDVDNSREFLWKVIAQLREVSFYCLSAPREEITARILACSSPADRKFLATFEEKLYPINQVGNPMECGSCLDYETRRDVTSEVTCLTLEEFQNGWGSQVVVVASLKRRLMALGIYNSDGSPDLEALFPNRIDYIYLERIGRSRARGVACSGPGSLIAIGKDSKRVFYHVKRLLNIGLVEKYEDSSTSSGILRVILTRFRMFRVAEDEIDNFSRILVRELCKRPDKMMPYTDVRAFCPHVSAKRLLKIFGTEQCKKRFTIIKNVPYQDMFPNAAPEECHKKTGELKTLKCVQLLEPGPTIKEDVMDPDLDDESMVENSEPSNRDYLYNVPVATQVYRAILASGSRGMSAVEVLKKLDAAYSTLKAVMKRLLRDKFIEFQFLQNGRTRTRMFVISKQEMSKPVVQRLQKRLIDNAAIEIPLNAQGNENNAEMESELDSPVLKVAANDPRKMQRMAVILRAIKSKRILQANVLQSIVREDEERRNLKDKMDRRSLHRILDHLTNENLIKLFIKKNDTGTEVKFYTEPSYNADEMGIEEAIADGNEDPSTYLNTIVTETDLDMISWMKFQSDSLNDSEVILNSKKMYAPKFLRLSVLHDLIYYLVRGYTGELGNREEYLAKISETCPIDDELRAELPAIYSCHVSCYMFIPPLSPVHERIPGWSTAGEIILNSPLSLYTKLVQLKSASSLLQQYLDHPLRCFYPLRCLPPSLRRGLITQRQLSHFVQDLRRLCYMGLIKFGYRGNKRNIYLETFYVNLRACIFDTTTSRSGHIQVDPNQNYECIPYVFHSKADVKAYWVKLFNVCLETKLGHKNDADLNQEKLALREDRKEALITSLHPVTCEEAIAFDTGNMPGDNLGAGGIDSCLFSFLRSNWVGSFLRNNLAGSSLTNKKAKAQSKPRRPATTQNAIKKKATNSKSPKPRKPTLDELDLKATKLMRNLRVQWSKDEDNVALIIKAAMCFISPNSRQTARISWSDMRAALWRHVPQAKDKTQLAVRRRIQFLINRLGKAQLVNSLTQVLKNTPEVAERFDCSEIVEQIRPSVPNIKELKAALRNTFHELVDFMVERFIDNGHIVNLQELHLPDSMEELALVYDMSDPPNQKMTLRRVQEDSIRAILLSSMTSSNDKAAIASQLFEVYRQYDEQLLQSAVKKLHRQKVITLKRRMVPEVAQSVKYLTIRNSPYQFSFGFCLLMNTKYRQSVYHDAYLELNRFLCSAPGEIVELNLNSCGPAAFVLASLGHVELTASTPEHFVVVDTQLIPKNVSSKIMERYEELFKPVDSEGKAASKRSLEDKEAEGEPSPKRALLCTDLNEKSSIETKVAKALKKRREDVDMSEQSFGFRTARLALYTLREVVNREMESQVTKNPVDLFVVSSSKVLCTIKDSLNNYGISDGRSVKKILSKVAGRSDVLRLLLDEMTEISKIVSSSPGVKVEDLMTTLNFINDHGELGVGVQELFCYCDRDELLEAVHLLEENNLICRLGGDETRIVGQKFASAWALQSFKITRLNREKIKPIDLSQPSTSASSHAIAEHSTPIKIIMRPWLRIEGTVNRRVFDKFLGSILGHIMLHPGISVATVTKQFIAGLSPQWTKEIIDVLVEINCVTRFMIHRQKPSLFSRGLTRVSDGYTGFKADDEVLLEPKVDAIIKLGQFIGNKTYNKDILELPEPKKPIAK